MSGPVNPPGWVLSIPASLVLHAVPLFLLVRLFHPAIPDIFIVDLSEQPEVAQVTPAPSESARRPTGPPANPKQLRPHAPRAERLSPPAARVAAPAEPNPPSPPAPVAALAPEPPPRLPEPPPAQPPAPQPIALAPSPPATAQVAEPPRPTAPASDAVVAVPPAATVEREAPAPVSAPAPAPRSASPATTESPSAVSAPPTVTARVTPGTADASPTKTGTKTSTASNGAGGSSDAEYRAYLGLVRQRILESLRYPPAARQQGLVGTVYLEIVVQPTGAISEVKIVSPSAHPILDQAALETVRSLPSIGFPPGLTPRQLRARLPVMFNLR